MTVYAGIILALWLLFIAWWTVSAVGAKRSIRAGPQWRGGGLRLALIVLVLLALRLPVLRHGLGSLQAQVAASPVLGVAGVTLCGLGVGLAIAARVHLGRNWGMPMTRKEHPELVTSGPYALARHPIYGGMLLAMLGTALGVSPVWALPLVLFGGYFVYSARREEALMIVQFPDTYPAYMKRTKMLLPFLL